MRSINLAASFLSAFASTVALQCVAATAVISGNAPSYAGKTLMVRCYQEQVLNEEEELGQAQVAQNGDFRFEINIDNTQQVFIPTETAKAFIYVEPGGHYSITLPPYEERTLPQKLNPYFKPKEYLANIEGLQRTDINYQMMEFEDAFDFYTMKHVTYGARPDSLRKSIAELRKLFPDLKSPFQTRFKEYRYALLLNMGAAQKQALQDSVILRINKTGADYENPAFWDVFNNVFEDFVERQVGSEEYEVLRRIIATNNAKMLMEMLRERYGITNGHLRELAAIKITGDLENHSHFDRGQVIAMLQTMGRVIKDEGNRQLLQAMINKVSVNYIGTRAPDFETHDTRGRMVKVSDFRGKYVYINFGNTRIEKTQRDLQVLQRFHDSCAGALVVMNVFLYDTPQDVERISRAFKGDQMLFLSTPVPDAVKHAYAIGAVPSYIVLDRNGDFMMTKGAEPNDELRIFLQNTLNLK